jgi:hypothetical protein
MRKRETLQRGMIPHLEKYLDTGESDDLCGFIQDNSHLPGPRANLELADVFAETIASRAKEEMDRLWKCCKSLIQHSPEEAPVNSPQEFVPFCGAVGIGKMGSIEKAYAIEAFSELRNLSRDPRWRMREAVRMGLQSLLEKNPEETLHTLQSWIPDGNLFEMRAVAAAVGAPDSLRIEEIALSALQIHADIFDQMGSIEDRKTEAFRVLRKALGYTLSLVIAAVPQRGFKLVDDLISSGDPDLTWIVKSNLKKKRLLKKFPDQVESRAGRL